MFTGSATLRARRVALALPLCAAAVAARPFAVGLLPGVSFTMRTTSGDAEGGESAGSGGRSPSATRVRVQGATMRFDGDPAAQPRDDAFSKQSYTLLDAAGRRVVVVMPERRQFMEIRFDDSTTQALMAAATVTTTVTDVKVRGESMGAGEAVNGMATKRYRLTTDYKYREGGSSGDARTGTMHVVEDYWVSDKLSEVMDPLEQLGRTLGGRGGFGASPFATVGGNSLGELLTKRAAEQRRLFRGMPARTVTTTTDVKPDGEKSTTRSTTEISDVVRGDLDASLFRIPEGYTKFDMKEMLNVGAQMKAALRGRANSTGAAADSTSMLDAAKEGATEGAKEGIKAGTREAASRKIRGILRRP